MSWQLHTGTGAPGTIAGQSDGDNYIDTDAGDIYQLVGTTWSLCATFPGLYTTPPGDTTKFWRGDASWAVPPGGSGGDVTGPASATGDNLASFNGATGKIIKDSGSKTSDFAVAAKGVTNGDSHDHAGGDGAAVPEAGLSLSNNTTGDVSTAKHGFAPKAPNDMIYALNGLGVWTKRRPIEKQIAVSNATGDATNDITLSTGWMYDSTGAYEMALPSALTKKTDADFAAGTDQGGGNLASTAWYHVYIIRKDSDGSIDAYFDTSDSAANIPAGYTAYRHVGFIYHSTATGVRGVFQSGNRFYLKTGDQSITIQNPGTSAVLDDVLCPPNTIAILTIMCENSSGTQTYGLITSPSGDDVTPGPGTVWTVRVDGDNNYQYSINVEVLVDASSRIRYRFSSSSTSLWMNTLTIGWIDTLLQI